MKFIQVKTDHASDHLLENSEVLLERIIFNNRAVLLALFALLTLVFGWQMMKLKPEASLERMLPTQHPYIQNYLEYQEDLKGLGNAVRIVVETTEGDIFTAEYLEILKSVHDEVFFINGIDRAAMKSLWASAVRWSEVTEQGFAGGPVIDDGYDGSDESLAEVRRNLLKSGQVGSLVANNYQSAVIYAPLYELDPETGEKLDYQQLSADLERLVRDKYQSDTVRIHITGFAKVVGDLIEGLAEVLLFFVAALLITSVMLYWYSRSLKATLVSVCCSVIAVVWQLGLLHSLGYGLDPYSMLVPFLVFAIAVSHGVQVINAIAQEAGRGAESQQAARRAFRALYIPGLVALVSDGVGFATLMVIQIAVIQDLAVAASIGVAVIILTNLVLLPVAMSYVGVGKRAVSRARQQQSSAGLWRMLSVLVKRPYAGFMLLICVFGFVIGGYYSQDLKIGDLDPGAPELHPDSRYNLDNKFLTQNYSTSTDVLVVLVTTPDNACTNYEALNGADQLQLRLGELEGVQVTRSAADFLKLYMAAMNEGNLRWMALNRNQQTLDAASFKVPPGTFNKRCSLIPILVYLNDHKATTLSEVVGVVEDYAAQYNNENMEVLLGAGNAGIEAATNIVIDEVQYQMLACVYAVVGLLVLITFRSLRTLLCIMIPLALTSVLCQALMSVLGIGVKVATLPVIALGVGIGVDYGIYIYSKLDTYLSEGLSLQEAYYNTLKSTGKAVAFTGLTLAVGVGTWYFSPIKFQADMGLLLIFMFLWSMVGALVFLPALAHFLIRPNRSEKKNEFGSQQSTAPSTEEVTRETLT